MTSNPVLVLDGSLDTEGVIYLDQAPDVPPGRVRVASAACRCRGRQRGGCLPTARGF